MVVPSSATGPEPLALQVHWFQSTIMLWMMMPLEEHYDDGFGAVGDAFRRAAETLNKNNSDGPMLWSHLPEIYLLRHAVELFLKSGIIIMHRKLRLPYDSEPHSSATPMLMTFSGKWRSLFRTHDIPDLYGYWKKLIVEHRQRLEAFGKHGPDMSVPIELDGWIDTLGKADPNSDYFRYPVSKNTQADSEKSAFREVAPEALFPENRNENEYVRALVIENSKGEFVQAFKLDNETQKDIAEAAKNAAEMFSNFHAMMRVELTGMR
jgi:hypothetical protein